MKSFSKMRMAARSRTFTQLATLLLLASACSVMFADTSMGRVSFQNSILPILSEHCFACHGPDSSKRKADLRLDTREGFLAKGPSGRHAIVPTDKKRSELLRRIVSNDSEDRMPPVQSGKRPLTTSEINLIGLWIDQGAEWEQHWAFAPIRKSSSGIAWSKQSRFTNPIDVFIEEKLGREKLELSSPAPAHTWIRRVYLDLIGLPPSPTVLRASPSPLSTEARRRVIDQLLSSPRFGERMAMWWMDLARYSDTDGFQGDAERENWPWRDWVVEAFNRNMAFDQFTILQFAGDLIPNANSNSILATAFHRHHMTNGEGGRDPEESRIDYVRDRVNTLGTTWLGLTLSCAQCHSHKYDPVSQSDYYSLTAFFNNVDEDGKAGMSAKPYLEYSPDTAQGLVNETKSLLLRLREQESKIRTELRPEFEQWLNLQSQERSPGFKSWSIQSPSELSSTEGTKLTIESDGSITALGTNPTQDDYFIKFDSTSALRSWTGIRLEILPNPGSGSARFGRGKSGEFILTDVKCYVRSKQSSLIREIRISNAIADYAADKSKNDNYGDIRDTLDDDPRNGWTTVGSTNATKHEAIFVFEEAALLQSQEELVFEMRQRSTRGDSNIARFRILATDQLGETLKSLNVPPLDRWLDIRDDGPNGTTYKLKDQLFEQFLESQYRYMENRALLEQAERQDSQSKNFLRRQRVMVLKDRNGSRPTHVLLRGEWDRPGAVVSPGILTNLASWSPNWPTNRLGLAYWLMSRDNPLPARVLVNHLWALLFGEGLVRTMDDFGTMGEKPTHPELLDWLAADLIENDWDIRRILRLIASSETYAQTSNTTAEALARDPENRLHARGARYRLPSWMIRDAALASSGLLSDQVGGPPIKPFQPEGVWEELFMGRFKYEPTLGPSQFKRTLYAFWRRAVAPTFLFDSAQRRVCEAKTPRTNTPLQALVLMNDPTYVEAALELARKLLNTQSARSLRKQFEFLSKAILFRTFTPDEQLMLSQNFEQTRQHFTKHPRDAEEFLRSRNTHGWFELSDKTTETAYQIEVATWSVMAMLILNLDEAINHE